MTYKLDISVRGYEIDSFGHVNNAVYLNYFEQARWDIFRRENLFAYLLERGLILVVVDVHIRYVKEARLFDNLTVGTDINRKGPFLVFKHTIINRDSGERIARGTIKTLMVDGDRIPYDIPDEFNVLLKGMG